MEHGVPGIPAGTRMGQSWPEGIRGRARVQSSQTEHLPQVLAEGGYVTENGAPGIRGGFRMRLRGGIRGAATERLTDKAPCRWVGRST